MMTLQMWTTTLRMVALAATLLMAVPRPGGAHMSDECFVHVTEARERTEQYMEALGETSHLLRTYETESRETLANVTMDNAMTGFSRFMFVQLPIMLERLTGTQKMSIRIVESALAAINCAVREEKPPTIASPVDLDWLDDVMSELDERPPERVDLGVDCTEPFVVGLPDDVLTECEGEQGERR